MDNSRKFYTRNSLNAINSLICGGSIYQTFLMVSGVSEAQIGALTSVASVMQVVAMLLFSGLVDRLNDKKILSASALLMLPNLLLPLALLFVNLSGGSISAQTVFFLALALTVLLNLFLGFYNILCYKLPYMLIPMHQYARLCSTDSVISGTTSFLISFGITWMISHMVYTQAMTIAFAFASVCIIGAVCLTFTFRPLPSPQQPESKPGENHGFFEIFRLPSFKKLFIPNITRGLCTGVLALMTVIGIHELQLNEAQTALIATVSVIASIGGGLLYRQLSNRITSSALCLAGSIMMLTACVLMLPFHSFTDFLVCTCLVLMGQSIVNNTIPVLLTTFVPYNKIGQYTSYRMVLTTGAASLASFLTGLLLGHVPAVMLMIVAGLMQFFCGAAYYRFDKMTRRSSNPIEANTH